VVVVDQEAVAGVLVPTEYYMLGSEVKRDYNKTWIRILMKGGTLRKEDERRNYKIVCVCRYDGIQFLNCPNF
jgi:hypothetical protein